MRLLMSLVKSQHGTYSAQRKIPERLQEAVARILGNGKPRQVFLKKSLGTKDPREARQRAVPVYLVFDDIVRRAEELLAERPVAERASLTPVEIQRLAEYVFARELFDDERVRVGGRDLMKRHANWLARVEGREIGSWAAPYEQLPGHGISLEQLGAIREGVADGLPDYKQAAALGDFTVIQDQIAIALDAFGLALKPDSPSWPLLGNAALRAYVRALQAIQARNEGEFVETPPLPAPAPHVAQEAGETLRTAWAGWLKARQPSASTRVEYEHAVDMFVELHGNLPIGTIKKAHARTFREALQHIPRRKPGNLRDAPLPVLAEYGAKHPEVPKIKPPTINKLMGAIQAVGKWSYINGIIPDDMPWADPFQQMRLEEEDSTRGPFAVAELQCLFNSPVFTGHEIPEGGKGPTAFWLPLLSLFTGARLGELAGLRASDVETDTETDTSFYRD